MADTPAPAHSRYSDLEIAVAAHTIFLSVMSPPLAVHLRTAVRNDVKLQRLVVKATGVLIREVVKCPPNAIYDAKQIQDQADRAVLEALGNV